MIAGADHTLAARRVSEIGWGRQPRFACTPEPHALSAGDPDREEAALALARAQLVNDELSTLENSLTPATREAQRLLFQARVVVWWEGGGVVKVGRLVEG